jgi:hypothetical protein
MVKAIGVENLVRPVLGAPALDIILGKDLGHKTPSKKDSMPQYYAPVFLLTATKQYRIITNMPILKTLKN